VKLQYAVLAAAALYGGTEPDLLREAIERSQAALRCEETREQRRRARARREYDALASEMAHLLRERERERRETSRRTQAALEQARRLRSIARDTAQRAARTRNDTRAALQQAPVTIRSDDHGQAGAEGATVPAALTAGDGALSLRARPSSLKRDRDRGTTSTGRTVPGECTREVTLDTGVSVPKLVTTTVDPATSSTDSAI
jgi:hypothetical protein